MTIGLRAQIGALFVQADPGFIFSGGPKGRGLRSDYGQTLDALDQAYGLEHCFVGLFETLFTTPTYSELCHFLGIPYQEPAWGEKVNVSATKTVIPDDLLAEMGRQHADDLKRAQQALPNLDLQPLWPTASRWCR